MDGERNELAEVRGELALVLPQQVAGPGVERLNQVIRVRQIHHAVVDERRRFLDVARPHAARPRHLHLRDVALVDLIERTEAPAVERPPPRQPVGRIRLPQHLVGDRDEGLVRSGRGRSASTSRESARSVLRRYACAVMGGSLERQRPIFAHVLRLCSGPAAGPSRCAQGRPYSRGLIAGNFSLLDRRLAPAPRGRTAPPDRP